MSALNSLALAIQAVCPIEGVSGSQGNVRVDFRVTATPAQQAAAASVVAGFDWSDTAQATRDAQAQKATATANIDNGQLQSGIATERLVRALALVVLDEINLIRANFSVPMTARTTTQLVNAIKAKIAATAE